ncbi:hypothetical protein EV361DRAFT_943486 [Lentinula raphanica]|nr:hypothetical protein EV361DRAFT_943486 [Lentinula raphanica]
MGYSVSPGSRCYFPSPDAEDTGRCTQRAGTASAHKVEDGLSRRPAVKDEAVETEEDQERFLEGYIDAVTWTKECSRMQKQSQVNLPYKLDRHVCAVQASSSALDLGMYESERREEKPHNDKEVESIFNISALKSTLLVSLQVMKEFVPRKVMTARVEAFKIGDEEVSLEVLCYEAGRANEQAYVTDGERRKHQKREDDGKLYKRELDSLNGREDFF